MKNMDKALTVPKWMLTVPAENTPNAPEFICPKVLDFNEKKASLGVRSPWPLPSRATSCVITFWCLEKMKMFLWSYVNFFCRGRRWGVEANYAYLIPTWSINSASSRARESKKPTVGQKNIKIMSTPIVHRLLFFVCRFLHCGGCLIILIWSTCH